MDRLNDRRFDWKEDAPGLMDLGGATCTIDYKDAEGESSTRRITMLELIEGPRGMIVKAYCHEQRDMRHFRIDRIQGIIDEGSGEIIPFPVFFQKAFGISLMALQAASQKVANSHPTQPQRNSGRNEPPMSRLQTRATGANAMHGKIRANVAAEIARRQAAQKRSETAWVIFGAIAIVIGLITWAIYATADIPNGMILFVYALMLLPVSAVYWAVVFLMRGISAVRQRANKPR